MTRMRDAREPSIQQLKLFLLLAEELHFGQAARRAFVSQPTFSRHIRSLERNLGIQLVDRTTRTVTLTPAGHALTDQIRTVVDATGELHRQAVRAATAGAGRMVIGSFEAITSMEPVLTILDELRRRLSGVDIQIHRAAFDTPTVLLEGLVDAAFLPLPVPEGIQYLELETGTRCAVMCASDPLAQHDTITMKDLSDRPHIGWSTRVPKIYRDYWSCDPRPDGTPVRYSQHAVSDYESALLLISMGEGIQLPPDAARIIYPRPGVAYVDVEDLPPWTTALAWLPQRREHPYVAALRHATRDVLRKI
ncbi:LysR family transcriptional regulator [Streptomyces sp. NPDC001292]|uniref:LysR family transcriptional regulator n=1 Tax=Streptomyces sp. NPDC001292 TaxID=3364558 RepID=UPI0036BEB496